MVKPHSIANILSLADVRKICRVTLDTSTEPALCVHRLDGSVMKFVKHDSGLYVYDTTAAARHRHSSSASVPAHTMVSTVADQKQLFSRRQIAAADVARELYRKIGRLDEVSSALFLSNNKYVTAQ